MGTVYIIQNQVNGKQYVGVTTQADWEHRMYEHINRFNRGNRDHKLYQAFRKYGLDNFIMFPICSVLNDLWLPFFERFFIAQCDTYENGYNSTIGGDVVSDETRRKISEKLKGRDITWGDKIWESRRNNPNCKDPKDYVAKGASNSSSQSYRVRFPDGHEETFKGLRAFSRKHGLSHNLLIATLKSTQTHHKGFVLLERSNDYLEREYTQAGGSGAHPSGMMI